MSLDHLYLTHRPTIERILRFIAHRHRCDLDEARDFAGWARLKLIDNDCAILAQYQGRADIGSFLLVVVQRLFLDYRISKWGSWRPSAEAKRLGPLAVRFETLRVRDELSFEEAYQALRALDPDLEREVLDDLETRLPIRLPRRFEGEGVLQTVPDGAVAADTAMIEKETAARKRQAGTAVKELMDALEPQEQIILRLRFIEGMQIAEVARTLHVEAQPLYRQIDHLLVELRRGLAERGLRGEDLGWGADVRTGRGRPRRLGESAGDGKASRRVRPLDDGEHRHG